jgi:hypothetical protein
MKLGAARPGRDTDDIAKLLVLNGINSLADAEAVFESFYPGDALPERTANLVERIISVGLPAKPEAPTTPDLA